MVKFRKKPVVIEAFELVHPMHLPVWLVDAMKLGKVDLRGDCSATIETLEGQMRADPGDWIIQGVKGELYPCKPDIFAATYDPA
jgi:hypothetical protein